MTKSAGEASNVDLVRATLDAFNAHDLDACERHVACDFTIHLAELAQPLHGRAIWRQNADLMQRAFPDLVAEVDDIVAAGDRVALRLTLSGTHRGDFVGRPATGRPVRYVSHEFYRVAEGLLAEEWICSDTTTLMKQIS